MTPVQYHLYADYLGAQKFDEEYLKNKHSQVLFSILKLEVMQNPSNTYYEKCYEIGLRYVFTKLCNVTSNMKNSVYNLLKQVNNPLRFKTQVLIKVILMKLSQTEDITEVNAMIMEHYSNRLKKLKSNTEERTQTYLEGQVPYLF